MPKQVFIESRNKTLEFPDEATQDQINDAVTAMFPPTGEDMMNHVEQTKQDAFEGKDLINPVDSMSNDNYILFNNHLADKKTSLGESLGVYKDTLSHIIDEVGTGIGATAYTLGQGEVAKAAESAGSGMVAGTVGLTDLVAKVFNPRQHIPTKEEFIGKPITRLVDQPQKEGVTGLTYAWPREEQDVTNEDDYKKFIEEAKQRDADSINRLYAMELTMRGAPVEEIARGFQYVDPSILAGAASTALKTGASLFSKMGAKAAAGTALRATAPSAVEQAGLSAIEGTAGVIEGAASIPSRVIQGVGQVAEAVMPGTSVGAKAAALTGAAMSDAGLTAGVIGGAKATEKVAEVAGAIARIAKQEASRAGKLERVALDPNVSAPARRFAAGLAQIQPIASAAGRMAGQALKEGAKGAVVGGVIGGLAERNLEGVAAGAGAGTAFGGMFGAMHSAFDLGKEVLGRSTSRTRQQATGDINTFISTRPEIEQGAWADTMNKLVAKVGPERAASQMDAMQVAEAAGSKVRIATLDEINQGLAPGWLNVATNEIVLNPAKILADTASHEATHAIFNSVISRAFRPEIEAAIYGIADPVTGQIVKSGVFDDVALGKIAEQIRDAYGKNTIAANEFQGFANTLKNSTDPTSLSNARSRIADEMTAAYTGKLFDRSRAGRFNPDRLPLVYRKVLSAIEDGVLDKFRSVLYEKGMDLGFDNESKTFRNDKGKPIRIPELDAIVRKAFAQKLNAKDATTAKPDLIPTKPADRALWAKTYGGARGILNDDGTPKSQRQIDAEAAARWQDMTMRLSALPDSEKIGIDFNRDKSGKTVMTAKGQLSPSAINAILDSGALDPTAKAVLVEILNSMQNAEKSTFDTRYYGVYTRGKGGNKMVAGVKSASQNEILPYSVEINSKDGVLIRAVDMSKVRDRLATAMNKPQFKAAYSNPVDAIKDLRRYMENITQINAVDSATLLGGGAKGAMKRNLFYEALGFRLRNGETLLNAPDSVISKSQNTIKSYRAERFAKLVDSGYKFGFEEATSLERATRNFQPDSFTPEALPNGESFTNKEGYRILNKAGSKLFRTYDDTGKLIGVAESKENAMKKAQDEFAKKAMKEETDTSKSPTEMRFQPVSPEQDAAFLAAAKAGDTETAQRLVDEAVKMAGYDSETLFRGRKDAGNVVAFGKDGAHFTPDREYAQGYAEGESGNIVSGRAKINKPLRVDSALIESVNFDDFRNHLANQGLPLSTPAKLFAWSQNPKYNQTKTIGEAINAIESDSTWADFQEDPSNSFTDNLGGAIWPLGFDAIRTLEHGNRDLPVVILRDPKQIKSADPITYDDAGNVIPLSQRFNQASPDIRFQPSKGVPILGKEGDSETIPLYQKKEGRKLLFERDGKPKVVDYNYDLLNLKKIKRFKGPVEDKTLVSESQFDYDVGPKAIQDINDAIKSGAVDSLTNKVVSETLVMMQDPSIVAGKGWYSRMRVALKKVYGDFSETFAQLLGATSAQTPVDQNFLQAVEAAEMIKSGAYDNNRQQYLLMRKSMADGTIKQVIRDRGLVPKISIQIEKLQQILPQLTKKAEKDSLAADIKSLSKLIDTPEEKWTNANMSDIFMLGEDIIPRRNNGRKYNANSKQVLAVIGGDWLRVVDAPKTPNFAGNLTGRTLQATIDVWAARFMRRMIYGGTDAPWRIQYDAEVGVTNRDFAFSQIVLERAAKKLKMNPDDLQAVLWFGEKDIYSKKNWTSAEGKKKASFDEMFNFFFPEGGKPRTFSEVRDMLDKKKKK